MSKIIIKIEKEDVVTSKVGLNYGIECTNGMSIVFSPEALDELIQDYEHIKNTQPDEEV